MNACELTTFVNAVSCAIANCVSKEELPLVAAIFSQISSTLATIVVQNDIEEKANIPAPIEGPPGAIDIP